MLKRHTQLCSNDYRRECLAFCKGTHEIPDITLIGAPVFLGHETGQREDNGCVVCYLPGVLEDWCFCKVISPISVGIVKPSVNSCDINFRIALSWAKDVVDKLLGFCLIVLCNKASKIIRVDARVWILVRYLTRKCFEELVRLCMAERSAAGIAPVAADRCLANTCATDSCHILRGTCRLRNYVEQSLPTGRSVRVRVRVQEMLHDSRHSRCAHLT